jgi:alpha-tubulin suppressor-like RCC1 family protein
LRYPAAYQTPTRLAKLDTIPGFWGQSMRRHMIVRWGTVALAAGLTGCQSSPFAKHGDAAVDGWPMREGGGGVDATKDVLAEASAGAPSPPTIVRASSEPWGQNCPRGGVKIEAALDLDGNGIIDSYDRMVSEDYVCNVYPVSVSAGPQHSCALASDRTVWCWGADDVGQLGDYGEYAAYAPRPVAGVEAALALAVGGDFACVVLPTTGVRCWGKNERGQGGHGVDLPFTAPSCVTKDSEGTPLLGATSLALGGAHACVVLDGGTIACWGANDSGQLGDGTTRGHNQPGLVVGITDGRSIVAGGGHTCVLLGDSTVRCWGANGEGQLGDGTTTPRAAAVSVENSGGTAPLEGVVALAAGEGFTCALMQDSSVLCWGANSHCQLGLPTTTQRALRPVAVPVHDVESMVAGAQHVCAVLGSGKAICWGRNDDGQVGAPAGECRMDPAQLPLAHVLSVGAGASHSCAVDESGIWCWGDNSLGQLGIGIAGPTRSSSEPQPAIWSLAP